MQCTERKTARTRPLRPFAAVALTAGALLLVPAAEAQMNPPQARPQAQPPQTQSPQTQSPQTPSPSALISDEKLNAAAAAIGQVTTIRQSYDSKIAAAPSSDKQRLAKEGNDALEKAVTDQGLSVDEYNSIIRTAQNDPTVREKLTQRIPHSSH
jgi:predicted TIM-barrel fold metal-dependent hydrolase